MGRSTKRYPIVRISFDDHCQATGGEAELVRCEVFGILYKKTKKALHIVSWLAEGKVDHNADSYCILVHPGMKIKRLGWY